MTISHSQNYPYFSPKENLNKCLRINIIQTAFFDYNAIKQEINSPPTTKKMVFLPRKLRQNIVLNNLLVKWEIESKMTY